KLQEEEESHAQAKDVQATDVQPKDAPAKGIQYIRRYHGYKKKPQSESEARKNMIAYLKNTKGFKMEFFKGKIYDQIRPIFQARAFDSAKWRPILPEYSAVASIVRNASDHLRPFLMMDPPATLEALSTRASQTHLYPNNPMMNREEPDEGSGTMLRPWLSQQATNQFRVGYLGILGDGEVAIVGDLLYGTGLCGIPCRRANAEYADPPSSLRSNPSRQLWKPVLIALALIPVLPKENKKGRNKSGEKGKWNSSQREGTQGGSTNKSEKGSKEGTHLDRATTGDRIWKEINMFSRTNRFTPSMTAHQENNGQSRQRQARMLLPTRPIQGNLTLHAENPSQFRQRGNDDG
nr:peptidase S10, serine carboxypeptidase, alpha/beta hydrolase fold protein [Tanacetum cinerariifolium]